MYQLYTRVILFISLFLRNAESEDPFLKHMYGSCSTDSYLLTIHTSKPFSGRLFSKDFKKCLSLGNGSQSLSLSVGPSCGSGFQKGFQFSDQIYIQKDPFLQQVEDEVVEIRCEPLKNGSASLIRYGENVDPLFYQNLRTRFAVNESGGSLESLERDVRRDEWSNDEVENEVVDEGVYIQAWMDILPLGSVSQNYFYIGQNVSLIIKWKNPKTKHQPQVGSCYASSEKKESLRLTNPSGQSVQKIFPTNFTYSTSKSKITTATASFLMFKFAKSNQIIFECRLIFASKVPILLEARAEDIKDDDEGSEAKFNSLNQEIPSHYLRSDDLSAQESKQELLEIEREFEEPLVCMSRLKMVLAFGVLIFVLFIALVFSCMLWSRAKSFTSHLNSTSKFPGGLIPRPFKRIPGPYVVSSVPYR